MSIINIKHSSKTLQKECHITVIGNLEAVDLKNLKVMYFLHGLGSDNSTVLEKTNILRHCIDNNFIIIFPNADRSFYSNTSYGAKYYDYIAYEIPEFVGKIFNFNFDKKNLYIAGISMGGYGALKLLLNNNHFHSCISFSGSLDIVTRDAQKRELNNEITLEWNSIFGENLDSKHDLFNLATLNSNKETNIYLFIGKEDYLYEGNRKLFNHLKSLNYKVHLILLEGAHNYETFSKEIDLFFENFKQES